MKIVKVKVEDREDGGLRVTSDELPGLMLSGKNRTQIIFAIEPAVRVLLERKSEVFDRLRIDADCSAATIVGNSQTSG